MPGICPASAVLASTPTISQWWKSTSNDITDGGYLMLYDDDHLMMNDDDNLKSDSKHLMMMANTMII